jgi:flagellar biosynthesis/type III secretory pathway protein FliH
MDRTEAIEILKGIYGKVVTTVYGSGYEWKTETRDVCSDEEKGAISAAIEALEKAPTALDHIHNVVAENERKRGYEQAKAKYDAKLEEIKSRFKYHYFNKGYDDGYKEGYERGQKDLATSLARRITARFDMVLGVDDVLEEIDNLLEEAAKGE